MPRRVMHLAKGFNRGGAEVLLAELHRARPSADVSFGCLLGPGDIGEELRQLGASVVSFGAESSLGVFRTVEKLARHLKVNSIDVLHAHLPLAGVVARLAGAMASVPVVYSEHNRFDSYHPLTQAAAVATWQLQSHVVAVSEDVKSTLPQKSVPPVTVVRNGIDASRFSDFSQRDTVRAALGWSGGAVVVGTVAVFRPAKQLDKWLDAFGAVAKDNPALRGLLVGYGPLAHDVVRWIDDRGLNDKIHLAGPQQDVRPWLQAMDIFMMSSAWEGLPVAALEAMASGLPVISPNVGGVGEAVTNDVGALVEAGSPQALAEALSHFVIDAASRKLRGARGREKVAELFAVQRMIDSFEEIYRQVEHGR